MEGKSFVEFYLDCFFFYYDHIRVKCLFILLVNLVSYLIIQNFNFLCSYKRILNSLESTSDIPL